MSTHWISEYIQSTDGDWGRPGVTYCKRCLGQGSTSFMYCPWCGRKVLGIEHRVIPATGSMWNYSRVCPHKKEANDADA